MPDTFAVSIDRKAFDRWLHETHIAVHEVTAHAAKLLEVELKETVKVQPGPTGHPVPHSGELGGSIEVLHQSSVGDTEVFLAGPTAPYAKSIELKWRPGGQSYAWFRPGVATHRDRFIGFFARMWGDVLKGVTHGR